jgi:chorismate mutase/prephenate dehydratase
MGRQSVLTFTVRNEAGALAKAIEVIGRHGFNMRTLRSRPMRRLLWQYYFYVEAEGHIDSPEGEAMLTELNAYCDRLKVLGTYVKNEA